MGYPVALPDPITPATRGLLGLAGLATTGITGDLTLTKTGTTARTATFPDAAIEVQAASEARGSGNFTARLGGVYAITATATVTDPTPAEGRGFESLVRNGTATIGGTAYATAGTYVHRLYHSGAWSNYVYPHLDAAWTWTAAQTINVPSGIVQTWQIAGVTQMILNGSGILGIGLNPSASNGLLQVGAALAADTANFQAYFHNRLALFTRMSAGAYNPAVPSGATGLMAVGQGVDMNTLVIGTHASSANALVMTANGTGIGVTPTASNGLLQFASGTTKANGIAFGADIFIYRVAANQVDLAGGAGADVTFNVRRSTGENIILQGGNSVCQVGTASNHGVNIITNGAARIVISSTGQLHMFGGTPVTRSTYGAPTGTATRTTFDTTTITLPQLAERVKAMIDDFRARGDFA